MEITNEVALQQIGLALAHESLKLSQREHLYLIECYNVLEKLVKEKNDATANQG